MVAVYPQRLLFYQLVQSGSKLQLPMMSVVQDYKTAKVQLAMMLWDSENKVVQHADISICTGSKWTASKALSEVAERLRHADIEGTKNQGRLGLSCTRVIWKVAKRKKWRLMVQNEIRVAHEEVRQARAVAMRRQGSWTWLNNGYGRSLGWRDIWNMKGHQIDCLLCSVYDVLLTPKNLGAN